jgi:hypothetical protein
MPLELSRRSCTLIGTIGRDYRMEVDCLNHHRKYLFCQGDNHIFPKVKKKKIYIPHSNSNME